MGSGKKLAGVLLTSLGVPGFTQQLATVRGQVVDRSGSPVTEATVELDAPDGRILAESMSSVSGEFSFSVAATKDCVIRVAPLQGFAGAEKKLSPCALSQPVRLVLVPATVSQTVEVGSGADPLSSNAAANRDSVTVHSSELEHLPVFDQDVVSALLPFLDANATGSGGVSLIVDGIEMKSLNVTPSAIAEARINADPYSAEFASAGRGRLEITTKPGSQQFHGTFNFIARDAAFNAKNYFAPAKPPEQRRIFEGNLTGPFAHTRHTNFLITGTRQEEDLQTAVHAYTQFGLYQKNAPQPSRNSQVSGRVTHDFSDSHRFSTSYNFHFEAVDNQGVGGIVLPEAGSNLTNRQDQAVLNDRLILSPKLLNQLQVLFERETELVVSVKDALGIQVQDSFIGGGAQKGYYRTEDTMGVVDVVSWDRPRHYLRFGVVIPQISRRAYDDYSDRTGIYSFTSLNNYMNGVADKFTIQQGVGRGIYYATDIGAFVQDEITVCRGLQVTVGVRYQWTTYLTSGGNLAPRVSSAWAPNPNTVIRAGAGIFYDRAGGDFPATYKLHNGMVLQQYQVLNPPYPTGIGAGNLVGLPVSIVREDPAIAAPYQVQYSLTAERKLGAGIIASATYRGSTGIKTFRSRDANAPLPPYTSSMVRPDPTLGFVQQVESGGRSRLNAFDVALSSRGGSWFQGQAQYTLSQAYGNAGGVNWYPQDQYNPNAEWGPLDTDRRHKFNFLATIHPDHWLTLGIISSVVSGAPYSELAGEDRYLTGLPNARPLNVSRNTLQGATTATVDLQWDHDFHLDKRKGDGAKVINIGVSGFNVLNHANFASYVGNVQSPLFRQATVASAARQLQFGLRYDF